MILRNFVEFREINLEEMAVVMATILSAAIHGCNVALNNMLERGYGAIFNLEEQGSGVGKQAGRTLDGTSMAGLTMFTAALDEEIEGKPFIIAVLWSGLVWTRLISDLLKDRPQDLDANKRILGFLVDRVETMTL